MKRPSNFRAALWLWILCCCLAPPATFAEDDAPSDDSQKEEAAPEEPEVLAYALFLKQPRKLAKETILATATKAWGLAPDDAGKLHLRKKDGEFTLRYEKVDFIIAAAPKPWLEDQAQVIEDCTDLRMKDMLRHVSSHISISFDNHFKSDEEREDAIFNCLHLIAGFIDPADTLAVYEDDNGDFNYINDEVRQTLAGDDPLSSFEIEVAPPVTLVDSDNPAVKAAIAEAQRRWPEFAKNFRDFSDSRGPFLIKSRFGNKGNQEYMWSEVLEIRAGTITAILKNEPLHQPGLSLGDKLEIALPTLGDWVYPDEEGSKIGAFTMDVLQETKASPAKP